jgi:NADH:ubiquinone oxidoreductase subunit 6 (subunit J)
MDFFLISLISLVLFSSTFMVISKSPVNSVCFLILVFFFSSILFLLLNVDFIGFIFLMVYVGAVAVLFLFVIMMLYLKKIEIDQSSYLTIGIFLLVVMIFQFFLFLIYNNPFVYISFDNIYLSLNLYDYTLSNLLDESNRFLFVKRLGVLIFNENFIFLILVSFNLLVSMVGAILLTNEKQGYLKFRQKYQEARSNFLYFSDIL